MSLFEMSWDARSLKIIEEMGYADVLLAGAIQAGLGQSSTILIQHMQQLMAERFKNPTGRLSASLHEVKDSPFEVTVGSDSPYAWRRDRGFVDMVDVMGRVGTDEGIYYAEDAMNESLPEIGERMTAQIEAYLARIGA